MFKISNLIHNSIHYFSLPTTAATFCCAITWNDESSILIKCWRHIVLSSGSVELVIGKDVCCEYWYFKINAAKSERRCLHSI